VLDKVTALVVSDVNNFPTLLTNILMLVTANDIVFAIPRLIDVDPVTEAVIVKK